MQSKPKKQLLTPNIVWNDCKTESFITTWFFLCYFVFFKNIYAQHVFTKDKDSLIIEGCAMVTLR